MTQSPQALALTLGFPAAVGARIGAKYASEADRVAETAELILTGRADELAVQSVSDGEAGLLLLTAVLYAAAAEHTFYAEKGIADSIYYATMGDITAWAGNYTEDTGFTGLTNIGWVANHIQGRLFTLGRLQFEFSILPRGGTGHGALKAGDRVLNIHIPQGYDFYRGRLPESFSPSAIDASFKLAEEFFPRCFPDFDFRGYTCGSWLLAPALAEVLPEDSNILAFQRRFSVISVNRTSRQAEERVFGRDFLEKGFENYPRETSLQKSLYAYLARGNTVGEGHGIIERQVK